MLQVSCLKLCPLYHVNLVNPVQILRPGLQRLLDIRDDVVHMLNAY